MRRLKLIFICVMASLPPGCTYWSSSDAQRPAGNESRSNSWSPSQAMSDTPVPARSASPLALITADFVNAMQQMPVLAPASITVNLLSSDREDAFIGSMAHSLQKAGYGLRWVDDYTSEFLLQYRHEREAGDSRVHRDRFEVALGAVEMRRTYATDSKDQTRPVTPLYVRGADASTVALNDAAFNLTTVGTLTLSSSTAAQRQAVVNPVPLKPVTPRLLPADANPLDTRISATGSAPALSLPLVTLPSIENVFELGGSNYEDVLAGYTVVQERKLTFPNDSLRLGEYNKAILEQMVDQFSPTSDVFSLIGCSIGPTAVHGGNAALALGRSSRVREALLFSGVPAGKILDEGCWAGDSADRTQLRRGVVVTLNRK